MRHNNLSVINLRNSSLKGVIQLANYGNLTELDVSHNSIEHLDLSVITTLQKLDCSKNKILELTLNGAALTTVNASHNKLKSVTVNPAPEPLQHLNVSYNEIEKLPDWISKCVSLKTLIVSHNRLRELPQDIFSNEESVLLILQLSFNQLTTLPQIMRRVPIQQLFLQNNSLITLPRHFFIASSNLKVLNVSKNCLKEIPQFISKNECLEHLYLTSNALTDVTPLLNCTNLKTLHIAYNAISCLPEGCVSAWPEMQELVISGNNICHVPENVCNWYYLRVFRAHSNLLTTSPSFVNNNSLKILDLSHNYLEKVDIMSLIPKQLLFLDISGNIRLQVDSKQFHQYKVHRSVNLIDVSGFNRNSLPCFPIREELKYIEAKLPWSLGFSEAANKNEILSVCQLRLPNFCQTEALIGIFDTVNDAELSKLFVKTAPRIVLSERTAKETTNDYLKCTMLSLLSELKDYNRTSEIHIMLCHIYKAEDSKDNNTNSRYLLRIASFGDTKTILCRNFGSLTLSNTSSQGHCNRGKNGQIHKNLLSDLYLTEINLHEQDQFLLLASKSLWEVMSIEEAVAEVRSLSNPVLAAKRLQDLAQSYGCENSLSIIVLRFQNLSDDIDSLSKEMQMNMRSNRNSNKLCTCDQIRTNNMFPESERSSPSGQSDKLGAIRINQSVYGDSISINNYPCRKYSHHSMLQEPVINKVDQNEIIFKDLYNSGNLADGEESFSDRSGLQMAEERFRCWEYMLEQNTQMLFDKELDTLSKSFTKRSIPSKPDLWAHTRSVSNLPDCIQPTPFTKRFGSARSYNNSRRLDFSRKSLNGGSNAAYFGSLQHLMPYHHLEYDFSEIKEKYDSNLDSLEIDGRMHKYWDVATTEL